MSNKKQKFDLLDMIPEIDTPKIRMFFLGLLIGIFLTFDILFLMVGEKIKHENDDPYKDVKVSYENKEYKRMVAGHPMEKMVPYISRQDKQVASFLIAIAKKESNWGKYAPKKDGRDCYNYWGYRGSYNQTDSGYSCFDSPEQAVAVVGGRIEDLVTEKIDTPREMIVWKCGSTCRGHNPYDVKKWIADVDFYVTKINREDL